MEDDESAKDRQSDVTRPVAPWKRRDDESVKAYEAFSFWLKIEPASRRLEDAARSAGHKSKRHVERWSTRFSWMLRARAFDDRNDERADAAATEAREELMRRIARERVDIQLSFHEYIKDVPKIFHDVASDPEQSGSARVAACFGLIGQGGYLPEQPVEQAAGVEELMVAELLRTSSVLSAEKRTALSDLLNEAVVIRAAQRAAGAIDEAD